MLSLFRYCLVLAAVGLAFATFSRLPAYVPTHFNVHGQPNGFVAKPFGPFVLPMALVVLEMVLRYGRVRFVPADNERVGAALDSAHIALLGALFITLGTPFWSALSVPLSFRDGAFVGSALILFGFARTLVRIPQNAWIGIVTPRTLSSEERWRSVHRGTAWALALFGVAIAALALTSAPLSVLGKLLLLAFAASMACAVWLTSDQGSNR